MKSPMTKQPDETCITQQNHKEAQLFTAKHGYIPLSTELAIFYCSTWIVLSEIRSVNPSSSSWHIWNISPRMLQCSLEHKVCERTSAPHLIFQLLWLNLKKGFSKCFPSVEISTFNTESNQLSWPGRKCKLRLNLTGFPPSNLQRFRVFCGHFCSSSKCIKLSWESLCEEGARDEWEKCGGHVQSKRM